MSAVSIDKSYNVAVTLLDDSTTYYSGITNYEFSEDWMLLYPSDISKDIPCAMINMNMVQQVDFQRKEFEEEEWCGGIQIEVEEEETCCGSCQGKENSEEEDGS